MKFAKKINTKGDKVYFLYDFGRGQGQRPSTGVFLYTHPKNQVEKNHNKEAKTLLEVKRSEAILERQAHPKRCKGMGWQNKLFTTKYRDLCWVHKI